MNKHLRTVHTVSSLEEIELSSDEDGALSGCELFELRDNTVVQELEKQLGGENPEALEKVMIIYWKILS